MTSPAPAYRWVCHRCKAGNEPGRAICAACGFPATASANQITVQRGSSVAEEAERSARLNKLFRLFFPEGAIAGLFLLCSPFIAIELLWQGHILQGLGLLLILAGGSIGFVMLIRRDQAMAAWCCMWASFAIALLVFSSA